MQDPALEDQLRIYRKTWALFYTVIIIYYALEYDLQFITVFGVCIGLLWFTQIITSHFFYFTCNLIILLLDLILKVLVVVNVFPISLKNVLIKVLDETLISQVINLEYDKFDETKLFLSFLLFLICIVGLRATDEQQQFREDQSNPVHEQIAKYLNFSAPICMYALCYFKSYQQSMTTDWFQKVLWGLITSVYMQIQITKSFVRNLLICTMIILSLKDIFESKQRNYSLNLDDGDLNGVIFQKHIYQVNGQFMYLLKILILINFRYKKHLLTYIKRQRKYSAEDQASQSTQSYTMKKKLNTKKQYRLRNTIIIYILVILTMTFTNSISNIIVLFAVFYNIPNHNQNKFRFISGIGIAVSLIFQPNQLLYFVLLYVMSLVHGQDYKFNFHSHWILIQISRLYILFSKVSMINFLMGLFQSYILVFVSIAFRISFNYFGIISVFMGTQQKYDVYIIQGWIPYSIITDIPLWIYMLVLKTYSPKLRNTFSSSNITNIFQQYPMLTKVQVILKVLKVVHLLAYIAISFIILRNQPSFFVLLRIIILAVMIATDVALQKDKSTLRIIWQVNLYVSLMIAFVKYFYLLNTYKNLSDWLIALLTPLSDNRRWIGLVSSDESSLYLTFFSDVLIIILTVLVLFTLDVKIYEEYRQIVFLDENLTQKKQLQNEQEKVQTKVQVKNIHYLYRKYIKEIELNLKQDTFWTQIMSDFFIQIYFLTVFLIYFFLEKVENIWLYLPHFLMLSYALIKQEDRIIPSKLFVCSISYTGFMIILLYFRYVSSKLAQQQFSYDLIDMVSKYLLFLAACLFHQLFKVIKLQHRSLFKINSERRPNMLYQFLIPNLQAISLKNQIVILIVNCLKSLLIGYFMSFFFNQNSFVIAFNTFIGICLLFILKYGNKLLGIRKQQILKTVWVYPLIITFLFAVWIRQFQGILGLVFVRLYLLFQFQYEFNINLLYCQYMSQHQKQAIQVVNKKFNSQEKNKLSIILQEKPGVSNVISEYQEKNEQEGRWQHLNFYKTFLWVLPLLTLLIIAFSSLLTVFDYISALLTFVILTLIFIWIKYIQEFQHFLSKIKITMFLYLIVATLSSLRQFFWLSKNLSLYNEEIFLLYFGYVFFNQITSAQLQSHFGMFINSKTFIINFVIQRSQQAIQYWRQKSQLVSQLGSQIHNQKKLIKLQKYYINKENISYKVSRLIQQIQERSHQLSISKSMDFDNIDNIITFKEEDKKYELFSNMLILLSYQDIIFCLSKFNQYYKPPKNIDISYKIVEEMKQVRKQVLTTYHGSIQSAFLKYYKERKNVSEAIKKQIQSERQNQSSEQEQKTSKQKLQQIQSQSSSSSNTSEQSKANIQKQQEMEQQNYKCIQRIHQRAMQTPWLLRKLIQNSQVVGLVIVTGWNFFGGVYTIPINIVIFAWAVVLQTKTTVVFWSFIFIYAALIIVVKELLLSLTNYDTLNFIFYYHKNGYFYEFIIIFVCCIQIFLLKIGGTQNRSYSEIQSIYDSFYRKALNKVANKLPNNQQQSFIEVYKTLSQPTKHSFVYRVFSKSRLKPGKDYYPLMAGIQLIILLYIFFFYDLMQFQSKNNIKSLGQILTVTQFSKNMMIILFTQVIIIIVDRFIVSLNFIDSKNQALQNFFLNFAFSQNIKYKAPEDVTHVGIFDVLLIVKYLFHIFLLILINFFVYFYIPSAGFQKSLIQNCETSSCNESYTYLSIFLLLYLSYFLVSGLQIKHGFNRNKCKNTLMQNFHYINYYLYVSFTAIPFLWQFKKICDWTITTTALPLFHWMKFQDINARLYQSKCEAEMLKIKPRGKTPWSKYLIGPSGCLFILGLVFSPLIIYSSLNPFAVNDIVIASQINLNLIVDSSNVYKFFSTSHSIIYNESSVLTQNQLQYFRYADQMKTAIDLQNYNQYVLKMSISPDQIFKISQPAVNRLAQNLKATIDQTLSTNPRKFQFVLDIKILQKQGGQTNIQWAQKILANNQLKSLYKFLILNTSTLEINNFYSPIPGQLKNQSIVLVSRNNGQYFQLYTKSDNFTNSEQNTQDMFGIMLFFKSATKYKIGFSLVTFYVTYVLLISRLFRIYLTGDLDNVIYEGCQFERMLVLCDAVRSARILQNLYEQEYLYSFLIDMMKSPRTLKSMTGTFLQLRDKHQIK